jgi:hypothetical protein
MHRRILVGAALGLWVGAGGCYSPNFGDVAFECGVGGGCPDGYECRADDRCWRLGVEEERADADSTRADASSPDAGSRADASAPPDDASGPSPDAPDASDPGCTTEQILVNPGFDEGSVGWTEVGPFAIIRSDGVDAHTEPRLAWFGGYKGADDLLYQDVTFPAGAENLELTGFRQIQSSVSSPDDTLAIELRDTSDGELETLLTFDGTDAGNVWSRFTATPTGSYAEQSVRLYFHATTTSGGSPNNVTSFFIDTLALHYDVCD